MASDKTPFVPEGCADRRSLVAPGVTPCWLLLENPPAFRCGLMNCRRRFSPGEYLSAHPLRRMLNNGDYSWPVAALARKAVKGVDIDGWTLQLQNYDPGYRTKDK